MRKVKPIVMALCACLCMSTFSFGQLDVSHRIISQKSQFQKLITNKPFSKETKVPKNVKLNNLVNPSLLILNEDFNRAVRNNPKEVMNLELPLQNESINVELVKANIFGSEFKVRKASNPNGEETLDLGNHYWGLVKGDLKSFVSLSIFKNQISGLVTFEGKTFNLGKLDGTEYHVIHQEKEEESKIPCLVEEDKHHIGVKREIKNTKSVSSNDCVGVYVETTYDMFDEEGSVSAVTNFVTNVFAQVSALYANEQINLYISELWIWDINDPYEANDPSGALDKFMAELSNPNSHNPNYNGSIAHLLSYDFLGGVAYVDVLCNTTFGFGYSGISKTYAAQPAYSWTVGVISHEIGHNLGSPHTHACVWNGNNTPIDGCGSEAGYNEGCTGPLPQDGGTIMSYCHLTNIGIDFTLGFGQQPGDLVRNKVANAACLTDCTGCPDSGSQCNDNDDCTSDDTVNEDCECVGTYTDNDEDGVCFNEDPDDNDACVPNSCNPCNVINENSFEGNFGDWIDGGSDAAVVKTQASEGSFSLRLRDNTNSSIATSPSIDLSSASEINISFSYTSLSMETGEDFWIQVSQNGGSFNTIGDYVSGIDFTSRSREFVSITLSGPLSSDTKIRFRCDASANNDYVFIDDFILEACSEGGAPTCNDGVKNGNETGIDCGGPDCQPCAPTCNDGTQNGNETGTDCGGPDCQPCAPTCNDGIQNGNETGIDCGGPDCQPCAPTCNDGIQNGNETGIDCGGPDCQPCAPTCNDGIQNGNETGIDCGGPDCQPCEDAGCTTIANDNFESGWGIWNDGGSDAIRYRNGRYSNSGLYTLLLRDNSNTSMSTTDILDLINYNSVDISFSYLTRSMDNSAEDFLLEISTDGGSTYNIIEEWNQGDEFQNEIRENVQLSIQGPFTSNMKLRFRCDASANNDFVFLDDIIIEGCGPSTQDIASNVWEEDPTQVNEDIFSKSSPLSVKLYPNPISNSAATTIEIESQNETSFLQILNLDGKVIFSERISSNEYKNFKVSTNNFVSGTYLVFIQSGNEIEVEKLLIIR